jgi:hypothetical protein
VNGPGTLPEDLDATGATWIVVAFAYTHWQLRRANGLSVTAQDAATWTFRLGEWGLADHPIGTPQTYLSSIVAERLESWRLRDVQNRKIWLSIGGEGFGAGASSVYATWASQGRVFVEESVVPNLVAFMEDANVLFSGLDVDFEDTNALRTDNPSPYSGHDLMVWMGTALAALGVPYSFAPQSPYLTATVFGGFIPVLARLQGVSAPLLFIQFYNNPSYAVCTSQVTPTTVGWSIERILHDCTVGGLVRTVAGVSHTLPPVPPDNLYVLMPAQPEDAGSGFVDAASLSACIGDHSLHNGLGLWRSRLGGEEAIRNLFRAVPC